MGRTGRSEPTSTRSPRVSRVFQAVLLHTYSLCCPWVGRGTGAGEKGSAPWLGHPALPQSCPARGPPRNTPSGFSAHSPGCRWGSAGRAQGAASRSLLVLLKSVTILGLTFSVGAASGTDRPSRQAWARPCCFNQPPRSDFSLDVVTHACVISLGQSEK